MKKLVLVTGGFDPLHSGHISYFKSAKQLGDILVVGINSDKWLVRKKGRSFMPFHERMTIVKNLKDVDFVIEFNDDDSSAKHAIKLCRQTWPDYKIVFANGGDRTKENIPEMDTDVDNIEFVFGVGGENKMNYRVLHEVPGMKVKELTVDPGKSLSMQRHFKRSEFWIVSEGEAAVNRDMPGGYRLPPVLLKKHDQLDILIKEWHQLTNPYDYPVKIVEIQYGEACDEEDIERK
jgi:cytidyltransferase-like protein